MRVSHRVSGDFAHRRNALCAATKQLVLVCNPHPSVLKLFCDTPRQGEATQPLRFLHCAVFTALRNAVTVAALPQVSVGPHLLCDVAQRFHVTGYLLRLTTSRADAASPTGRHPVCIDGCYPEHHAVVPHQVTHLLEVHPRDLLLATTTTGSSRTTEYNPCGA